MKKSNSPLRRVIVDYKKLTHDILDLLVTKYPDGYDDDHIVTFRNAQNELIECVEVRTSDTVYLVKISKRLVAAMEDFDSDDDDSDTDLEEIEGTVDLDPEDD